MRETRVLVSTLMYRLYGPAMASWLAAFRFAERTLPGVRFDHIQQWGTPEALKGSEGHAIVTHKYMETQRVFRSGEWWALITLEDDMIVPEDAFVRLVELLTDGADIGYGLYVWRHGRPRWSAYTLLGAHSGASLSLSPERARAAWGRTIPVAGVGLGCTAIKRDVVHGINFRRGGPACNDWYLALDAQRAGLVQRCDLGLVCGHMTMEPSPRALWPDPDAPDLYRVEMLG